MKGTLEQLYSAVEYNARHLRHTLDAIRYAHMDYHYDGEGTTYREGCVECILIENVSKANTTLISQLMDEQRD